MSNQKLSVYISYILRHNPSDVGLELEEGGWVNTDELINGINKKGDYGVVDYSILKEIVSTDEKGRYSFSNNFSKIRANQGHSVDVVMNFEEKIPPSILYHGTSKMVIGSIAAVGITRGKRQYVHLSSDYDTALKVGKRHGPPTVLSIDTVKMLDDGYKFFISDNDVWLCEKVPVKYIV